MKYEHLRSERCAQACEMNRAWCFIADVYFSSLWCFDFGQTFSLSILWKFPLGSGLALWKSLNLNFTSVCAGLERSHEQWKESS